MQLVGVAETTSRAARAVSRFHVAGFRRLPADARARLAPIWSSVVVPTNAPLRGRHRCAGARLPCPDRKAHHRHDGGSAALIKLAARSGSANRRRPCRALQSRRRRAQTTDRRWHLGQIFYPPRPSVGPFPPRIRDVGVILDLATHDLDAMRYLTGAKSNMSMPRPSSGSIRPTKTCCWPPPLRNGAIGMLDVNWLTPTKVRELRRHRRARHVPGQLSDPGPLLLRERLHTHVLGRPAHQPG